MTNGIDAVLVRSATEIRQELLEACPSIKLIGRGGVGMDNIDVQFAEDQGIHVINTPEASSSCSSRIGLCTLIWIGSFSSPSKQRNAIRGRYPFQ